ncbi:unnamed protein product (macronuclear) [Paramecium tetraurelia]|uniref:Uncharacterized protein n=1 Tax=Paramecium tetraurelia TaxID=5888 RepID=A0DII4_PARTE|nr:uncharacterized protein GSPATT00039515001 [Paramecium tetraurelia]CAK82851.1 unnamed protein product [Paramecium tetraurelia]|eukprot:XP_001450248.1 hypothetical protein (macronuclear) [Paramecium tetraurelia strain d4-2]
MHLLQGQDLICMIRTIFILITIIRICNIKDLRLGNALCTAQTIIKLVEQPSRFTISLITQQIRGSMLMLIVTLLKSYVPCIIQQVQQVGEPKNSRFQQINKWNRLGKHNL